MKWKDLSIKEKIKKVAKYTMNILAIINALIMKLSPIWGWNLTRESETIAVIIAIIGVYLVSGKLFEVEEIIPEEDDKDE